MACRECARLKSRLTIAKQSAIRADKKAETYHKILVEIIKGAGSITDKHINMIKTREL